LEPGEVNPFVSCLNPGSPDRVPFFAAPGGWGTAFSRDVVAGMDGGQPCWAFRVLGSPLEEADYTLESLAATFVNALEKVHPAGPCVLGGYSMGGVTAMEMAHQLRAKGRDVPLLLLLDSGVPRPSGLDEPLDPVKTVFWVAKQVPDVSYQDARLILEITRRSKRAVHTYLPRSYDGRAVLILSSSQESLGEPEEEQIAADLATAWRRLCMGDFEMVRHPGEVNRITAPPGAGPFGATIQNFIDAALSTAGSA